MRTTLLKGYGPYLDKLSLRLHATETSFFISNMYVIKLEKNKSIQ